MKKLELKEIIREEIKKIFQENARDFRNSISRAYDSFNDGEELSTHYFKKFIGMPLFDGKVVSITVDTRKDHPVGNHQELFIQVVSPNKYRNIEYLIDADEFKHTVDFDKDMKIPMNTALGLSKIIQHINPDTKYKNPRLFNVK